MKTINTGRFLPSAWPYQCPNQVSKALQDEAVEHWHFCSSFMQQALLNRYRELSPETSLYTDWFDFLVDEFGLEDQT